MKCCVLFHLGYQLIDATTTVSIWSRFPTASNCTENARSTIQLTSISLYGAVKHLSHYVQEHQVKKGLLLVRSQSIAMNVCESKFFSSLPPSRFPNFAQTYTTHLNRLTGL
nr:hypothetical transcript [Hymenolepis microstoma]